jgi:hypothetical protein
VGDVPTASWTVTQPWRGVFGMLVCLGIAFGITCAYGMDEFMGLFTAWAICIVPIEVVVGIPWMGGAFPAGKLENPWKGFAIIAFMFFIATIALVFITKFIGGSGVISSVGPIHPLMNVWIIGVVILTFFGVIAFDCWPFQKMSLPAKGFLTLLAVYLIWTAGFRLLNFDTMTIPALEPVFGTIHVPAYVSGGIFANLAGVNPSGPIAWDQGMTFFFGMVVFLFVFVHLGMWPFSKFKSLMSQPTLGIVLFIACFAGALISYAIGVWGMDIDPIKMMLYYVCYAFGMLGILFMFQMWPGRLWKGPVGGFVNLLVAAVLAIIAFWGIQAFCSAVFGDAYFVQVGHGILFAGPSGWFAMMNVMLALTFPAWAVFGPVFDFWPLPPTPAPPG